jgi:hypothetical protein
MSSRVREQYVTFTIQAGQPLRIPRIAGALHKISTDIVVDVSQSNAIMPSACANDELILSGKTCLDTPMNGTLTISRMDSTDTESPTCADAMREYAGVPKDAPLLFPCLVRDYLTVLVTPFSSSVVECAVTIVSLNVWADGDDAARYWRFV